MSMQVQLIDREAIVYLVNRLEGFEKDNAIRSGLRAAVMVFKKGGQRRLRQRIDPEGKKTNHLYNSFTTRVKRDKLGALAGFDRPGGNHAHLVDLGTKRRYTTGRKNLAAGIHRGIMPSNLFWHDTKEQDMPQAVDAMYDAIKTAVDRINARR